MSGSPTITHEKWRNVLLRARRRAESDGAVLFIVAMTLGLLAAIGVYGMSATALDLRAAGHSRETMQNQHVAEHAMISVASSFDRNNQQALLNAMFDGRPPAPGELRATRTCRTAATFNPVDNNTANQQACLAITPEGMRNANISAQAAATGTLFTTKSLGGNGTTYPYVPHIRVELSNPFFFPCPGSDTIQCVRLTATVIAEQAFPTAPGALTPDLARPPVSVVLGRGGIIGTNVQVPRAQR
jgi:hypothetical protein